MNITLNQIAAACEALAYACAVLSALFFIYAVTGIDQQEEA